MKSKKSALLLSFTSLLLCFAMLAGSTFAWFTDTATTGVNKIVAGNLKVDIVDAKDQTSLTGTGSKLLWTQKQSAEGQATAVTDADKLLWEPGVTFLTQGFKIKNDGNLALKWKMTVNKENAVNSKVGSEAAPSKSLLDVIDFSVVTSQAKDAKAVAIEDFVGHLLKETASTETYYIKAHMQETAGNDYQNLTLEGITITVYATQDTVENDSYGDQYDKDATYYPVLDAAGLKDALVNGGNITIAGDFTGDATKTGAGDRLTIKTPTTLNFEGVYTVPGSLEDSANWAALYINDETTINAIDGAGIICEDKTDSSAAYIGGPFVADVNAPGKTVTVNGGTYYGGGTTFQVTKGTLVVNGGFFKCAPDINTNDYRYLLNCIDENYKNGSAKIIVKGGTFVNFDPSNNAAEGADTNFVAEGYSVICEEQANGDKWYTVVKGTGVVAGSQEALTGAINNATTGSEVTVKLTKAGTYTLPVLSGKDITIVGTKDTVVDMKDKTNGATNIGFEGVTVEFGTSNFVGFQHTGKLTYKDCTIKGKQILYAKDTEFVNCVFEQTAADYNLWTYGGNVTFTDCTFISNGKFINAYRQQNTADGEVTNLTLTNCKFVNNGSANKAAVNIKSQMAWNVIITSCTTEGEFPAENNGLWQSAPDDGAAVAPGNTVTVN